jgi:Uma2 family endonuclease
VVLSRLHAAVLRVVPPEQALLAPLDVCLDEHNVFQPDLVVAAAPLSLGDADIGIPLIAMEVLSPSTEHHDRHIKTARLLAAGVAEVWLLDIARRRIEVHATGGKRVARGAERLGSQALAGLDLVPERLFA